MATDVRDTMQFGERVFELLARGRTSTTYKYATLLGLIDLCLEKWTEARSGGLAVTTRELAERVLDMYWRQVRPYWPAKAGTESLLRQSRTGTAEILTELYRAAESQGYAPIGRVRIERPDVHGELLDSVEWKLVEMPLPRLQQIGKGSASPPWIYEIGWDDRILRKEFQSPDFDSRILLLPGVDDHLVRLSGLLRPLIQHKWAQTVAQTNDLEDARLHEHLFGAARTETKKVQGELREIQDGECFYCGGGLASAEVDHFLPYARCAEDGLHNLVAAHPGCNRAKSDYLAAVEHLARWAERNAAREADLREVAVRARWPENADRSLRLARTLYLRLDVGHPLWVAPDRFAELTRDGLACAKRALGPG